jgi:hypothetical protein
MNRLNIPLLGFALLVTTIGIGVSVIWYPGWLSLGFFGFLGLLIYAILIFTEVPKRLDALRVFLRKPGKNVIGCSDEEREQIMNVANAVIGSLEPFRTSDPNGVSVAANKPYREALNQLRANYANWQILISPKLREEERKIVHSIGQHRLGMLNLQKGEEVMRIRETVLEYTNAVTCK